MMLLLKTCFFSHTEFCVPSMLQLPMIPRVTICHLSCIEFSFPHHTAPWTDAEITLINPPPPPALFPGQSDKGEGHVILSGGPLVLFPLAPFHTAVCAQTAPPEPEPPGVSLISMNREPGTGTTSTRKRNTVKHCNTFRLLRHCQVQNTPHATSRATVNHWNRRAEMAPIGYCKLSVKFK